jgi:hypothetical protein
MEEEEEEEEEEGEEEEEAKDSTSRSQDVVGEDRAGADRRKTRASVARKGRASECLGEYSGTTWRH